MALTALVVVVPASAGAAPVPLVQAGSAGSGAGQLLSPRDVAVDGVGNVYVADATNSRISVFGPDGTFIRAFGWGVDTGAATFEVCTTATTCQMGIAGGGAGQLNFASGLAIDDAGNLYVTEIENDRISVFSTAGPSFVRAFGWDVAEPDGGTAFEVCPTDGACRAGDAGDGAGQLSSPGGAAADSAGNLYVSEPVNRRISVFGTATPSFSRAFGFGVDTGAAAFEVCTTASTCQGGSSGSSGAGALDFPRFTDTDAAGNLYVAEQTRNRISVFDAVVPSFTQAFGFGVDTGAAAFEVCTTVSTCQTGLSGTAPGQLDSPFGVATECPGAVWVSDTNNGRLQRFGEPGTGPAPSCASGPPSQPPAAAPPISTDNALCPPLRTKLKKLKRRLAQVSDADRRAAIKAKIRKIRKKLRKLGC